MLGKALLHEFARTTNVELYIISHSDINNNLATLLQVEELKNHHFDGFYHCAAEVNVNLCESDFLYAKKANVDYTKELFEKVNSQHYFYISTDSVYGGEKGDFKETDYVNPVNNYAITKLMGELVATNITKNLYIIRTNIFGADSKKKSSLFEWAKKELEEGRLINGFNNIYFNPLSVQHLSLILKMILDLQIPYGMYNIGCNSYLTKYEFLVKVAEFIGRKKELVIPSVAVFTNEMALRPINTTLNCEKVSQYLNAIDLSLQKSFQLLKLFGYEKN